MSALDAHVGKAVFQNVLQDATSGKTRILVTHALHFLPQVDYIYVISDGRIAEQGSYAELMATENGEFARFMNEFGGKGENEKEKEEISEEETKEESENDPKKNAAQGSALMQVEERNTGAIPWKMYKAYLSAANAAFVLPILFMSVVLLQGASVMAAYW